MDFRKIHLASLEKMDERSKVGRGARSELPVEKDGGIYDHKEEVGEKPV